MSCSGPKSQAKEVYKPINKRMNTKSDNEPEGSEAEEVQRDEDQNRRPRDSEEEESTKMLESSEEAGDEGDQELNTSEQEKTRAEKKNRNEEEVEQFKELGRLQIRTDSNWNQMPLAHEAPQGQKGYPRDGSEMTNKIDYKLTGTPEAGCTDISLVIENPTEYEKLTDNDVREAILQHQQLKEMIVQRQRNETELRLRGGFIEVWNGESATSQVTEEHMKLIREKIRAHMDQTNNCNPWVMNPRDENNPVRLEELLRLTNNRHLCQRNDGARAEWIGTLAQAIKLLKHALEESNERVRALRQDAINHESSVNPQLSQSLCVDVADRRKLRDKCIREIEERAERETTELGNRIRFKKPNSPWRYGGTAEAPDTSTGQKIYYSKGL